MVENNYINEQLLKKISDEQNVKIAQIKAVLKLIEEGGTVPFIARYRKEATGGLDEEQIRAIYQEWDYGQKLAERKEAVMRLIEEKGKLTEEIKRDIINATKLAEVEDIYRPYKEKRKRGRRKRSERVWSRLRITCFHFRKKGMFSKKRENMSRLRSPRNWKKRAWS